MEILLVNREILQVRLVKLREYVGLLKKIGDYSLQTFTTDPFVRGNAERYLQLAIQCLLDIGNHIIADEKYSVPQEYRDVFRILGEEGVIPHELAERLAPAAGLRNILVHDYLDIDPDKVYSFVKNQLGDFEQFAKHVEKFL